jgi:CBS domain-containing protein
VRARDLAVDVPTVSLDSDAFEAARLMAEAQLPGLVVVDDRGRPYTVLPGSQVLRFLIPPYIQDDPVLARALDEAACAELFASLVHHRVREVLPRRDPEDVPVVDADATTLEVAAVMARVHSPIVAVVDDRQLIGAIRVGPLLEQLLPAKPAGA